MKWLIFRCYFLPHTGSVFNAIHHKTVTARYVLTTTNMVWVDINDPGIGGGFEGFKGQMSKYETTNAQYCQFLNSAMALGQIVVVYEDEIGSGCYEPGRHVYAVDDINHSRPYYQLDDPQNYNQITYSEATHTFSVRIRDGYSMNDHPVSMVSFHGAKAFCDYCGYRLPTEWEWVAVADYDGSYYFYWPCGLSIDQNKANYNKNNPLGLTGKPYTTPVGHFSTFGYGLCDMAGNVREWLAASYGPYSSQSRGGSWDDYSEGCKVQEDHGQCSEECSPNLGFRVCR